MPVTKLIFDLEFLTPAFIGGTDPSVHADFTLKPLKAVLRYWWRQFQDNSDSAQLLKNESKLFGDTDRASPVALRLIDNSRLIPDTSGSPFRAPNQSGRAYLLYSCIGRGYRQPGRSKWITPGSVVSIEISFRNMDDPDIRAVLFSLWLTQTFGGLGTRSRRGAGSFQLSLSQAEHERHNDTSNLFNLTAANLINQIRQTNWADDFWISLISPASPLYSALTAPDRLKVTSTTFQDANSVLDHLGQLMKDRRSCWQYPQHGGNPVRKQARSLHQAGNSGAYVGSNRIEKTAFGLPIVYNFKQRNCVGNLIYDAQHRPIFEDWQIIAQPTHYERRASPLFLSVKRRPTALPEFYANILILWNGFLPPGETIQIEKKSKSGNPLPPPAFSHTFNQPTASALEDYVRSIP